MNGLGVIHRSDSGGCGNVHELGLLCARGNPNSCRNYEPYCNYFYHVFHGLLCGTHAVLPTPSFSLDLDGEILGFESPAHDISQNVDSSSIGVGLDEEHG